MCVGGEGGAGGGRLLVLLPVEVFLEPQLTGYISSHGDLKTMYRLPFSSQRVKQ